MVTVYIAPQRSLIVENWQVKRPGEQVRLPRAEAERLQRLGFVQATPLPDQPPRLAGMVWSTGGNPRSVHRAAGMPLATTQRN